VARGIRRMMDDSALRERIARAGLAKAREFTWERTADQLLRALGVEASRRENRTKEPA
jgi:glycosyltransferase involved in cell wall biosynthesis